jgi:hypothetical protein
MGTLDLFVHSHPKQGPAHSVAVNTSSLQPLILTWPLLQAWPGGPRQGLLDLLPLRDRAAGNPWLQAELMYRLWVASYLTGVPGSQGVVTGWFYLWK